MTNNSGIFIEEFLSRFLSFQMYFSFMEATDVPLIYR